LLSEHTPTPYPQIDEALRIRREEELPVYERIGDLRSKAVTMGKIANNFLQHGQIDEALNIYRKEELPVYELLGDVHSFFITRIQIGIALLQKTSPTKTEFEEAREHLLWARATAEKHKYSEATQLREIVTQWFGGSV
jgi:hypothetical protein